MNNSKILVTASYFLLLILSVIIIYGLYKLIKYVIKKYFEFKKKDKLI